MNTIKLFKSLLITILLASSCFAAAQSIPMTKTFEALAKDVRLPATPSGTVSLRECDECDYHSLRVTPRTIYHIDGKNMSLTDFKKHLQVLKLQSDVGVNIRRDDASNTVSTIFVYSD